MLTGNDLQLYVSGVEFGLNLFFVYLPYVLIIVLLFFIYQTISSYTQNQREKAIINSLYKDIKKGKDLSDILKDFE